MVDVAADLEKAVKAMRGQAVRANARATIQATNVLFVLLRGLVVRAWHEEFLSVEGF